MAAISKLVGVLDQGMTPATVRAATMPVALVGSAMPSLTFLILVRLLGRRDVGVAFLAAALLATEPFLVGHSRAMHLDMLVTTFGWLGALAAAVGLLC